MKKKALTTVALGAATLAAGMAGNVHADSVKVTKQQIGDETKITTTTTKDVNQQKIAQDKQNISSQQTVVSSAKSSLDKAKANASSASQVVSSAQSKVNDAKKALDAAKASQPDQIKHQVATDQSQVNTDKQNISNTQSSITTDKNNIAKDQQAINNVGQKAQQDQNKLNNDQSKLSSAQSTAQKQQNIVSDTQSKLDGLKRQVSQNYIPDVSSDSVNAFSKAQMEGFLNGNTSYHQDPSWISTYYDFKNDNYKVNPFNLTQDQQKEIDEFAAAYVNKWKQVVLDKFGNILPEDAKKLIEQKATTSENADKFAIDITNYLNRHDVVDPDNDNNFNQYYSDVNQKYNLDMNHGAAEVLPSLLSSNMTMGALKNAVMRYYDTLMTGDTLHMSVIFNNVVSVSFSNQGMPGMYSNETYANSTNNLPDSGNYGYVTYTPINQINDRESSSASDLQNQIDNLQNQLNNQNDVLNKDKQVVNDLQNQVNADKAQLQKDTLAGLQQQLQNDQKKLADDQATLQKQQQKLAQDEAQLKADQNKLNSITPEYIASVKKALEQAQVNYNNAVKALNDAQSKANVSNGELAKAQQNYINALNKLNELKQILENDEKQITTTSVQWIKNQHPATTSSMGNKIVLYSSSETNTVHADTVNAVELAQADAIHFTSETSANAKKSVKKNALPQMGDENSNKTVWGEISLAMAGVLATLGLADRKRSN